MADDDKLKRERAGTYRTADGRFTVEQSSSGWLVLDAEQTDGLGLPLTRGPFGTLDEARDAIAGARRGPAPVIELPTRGGATKRGSTGGAKGGARGEARSNGSTGARSGASKQGARDDSSEAAGADDEDGDRPRRAPKALARAPKRSTQAITYRDLRTVDGPALRELWEACGFRTLGDDDLSLARMARRNPGLLLVAAEGTRVVGSALGAWDGRRGWVYHVAVAASHRRRGIASRLLDQVEAGLRDIGCPKVSALVRDENADGAEFWTARGYQKGSRQFARELGGD